MISAETSEPPSATRGDPARTCGDTLLVEVLDSTGLASGCLLASIREQLLAGLRWLGQVGEVRVRLVSDVEMASLHARHCGDPATTDVLTFDLSEPLDTFDSPPPPARPLDVDLIACLDVAARQARQRGHTVESEVLLYCIHGVLHCIGHDDHDEAAAAAMHAREDEVLRAIGVGSVFIAPPETTAAGGPAGGAA